jgi:hypothetical protein
MTTSKSILGSIQSRSQWIQMSFPGVKREAGHSHPSNAEIKSVWGFISHSPTNLRDVALMSDKGMTSSLLIFLSFKSSKVMYSEDIWQLCWLHGTGIPLCAITASVAAFPSPSGTAAKYPYCNY